MRRFIRLLVVVAFTLILCPTVWAQSTENPQFQELLKGLLEEKLKLSDPYEGERTAASKPIDGTSAARPLSGYDAALSGNEFPESEVHAAINPRDTANIIVAPIRYIGGGFDTPIYYTKDFGGAWAKSNFNAVPRETGVQVVGGGDPMFTYDADGRAYFSWINVYPNKANDTLYWGLLWAYSDDGGATWERAPDDRIAFARGVGGYPQGWYQLEAMYDKQWMTADRTESPYRNTVYTAYVALRIREQRSEIVVSRKRPNASGFSPQVQISDGRFVSVQFSSIDVDPQGGVHVTFFGTKDGSNYALWHSISDDGGAHFSDPVQVSRIHIMRFSADALRDSIPGIAASRLYPCPHVAIDRSGGSGNGNIYTVWTADGTTKKKGDGLDIYFSRSTDNGLTWSDPIVVNDDQRGRVRHQFYPTISVTDQGAVVVAWYDRRDDPLHRSTQYYVAKSIDGGRTFLPNRSITSTATDFSTVGKLNRAFGIGEYNQMLTTSDFAIPVWSDGRANDGDLDVYVAFVPLSEVVGSGVSDVARLVSVTGGITMRAPIVNVPEERATLTFTIDRAAQVHVEIVDAVGAVVAVPVDAAYESGAHTVSIGIREFPSGRYFCRLHSGTDVAVASMSIVR